MFAFLPKWDIMRFQSKLVDFPFVRQALYHHSQTMQSNWREDCLWQCTMPLSQFKENEEKKQHWQDFY